MSADFDSVNTLWYMTGDEGCGCSHIVCVVSEKRANTYFGVVKKPTVDPFNERRFCYG